MRIFRKYSINYYKTTKTKRLIILWNLCSPHKPIIFLKIEKERLFFISQLISKYIYSIIFKGEKALLAALDRIDIINNPL